MRYQLSHDRIVRERERREITGVPSASWYRLMTAGQAPRPIPLGPRSVGWRMSALQSWIRAQDGRRDTWQLLGGVAARAIEKIGGQSEHGVSGTAGQRAARHAATEEVS